MSRFAFGSPKIDRPSSLSYATETQARPLARRALITRRPFAVRIRTRNPETRLRLRRVPSNVRFIKLTPTLGQLYLTTKKSHGLLLYSKSLANFNNPGSQISKEGNVAGGLDTAIEVIHAVVAGVSDVTEVDFHGGFGGDRVYRNHFQEVVFFFPDDFLDFDIFAVDDDFDVFGVEGSGEVVGVVNGELGDGILHFFLVNAEAIAIGSVGGAAEVEAAGELLVALDAAEEVKSITATGGKPSLRLDGYGEETHGSHERQRGSPAEQSRGELHSFSS